MNAEQAVQSWRIRLNALPTLVVFYYRNLTSFTAKSVGRVMEILLECLQDENVEVREMAAKTLAGVIRCSQRSSIIALRDRFIRQVQGTRLPPRSSPQHPDALRTLHGGVLGLVALIEAYPYSVEGMRASLCSRWALMQLSVHRLDATGLLNYTIACFVTHLHP